MFILLSKILAPLIYPLGLSLILWIAAAILYRRGRTRWSLRCGVAGAVVVLFFSCPLVGESLLESLENDFEVRAVKAYPRVDAIVVLGGITAPLIAPRTTVDVNGGFDRLLHGIRLLKAKRAPHMLLSGGVISFLVGSDVTEAERLALLALEAGVAAESLMLESESRNTHENAVFCAAILRERGMRRILLVTSASHMRRAAACFRKEELEVIPVPTDIQSVPRPFGIGRFLPDVEALRYSTTAIKELVGWVVYWLRGYV